MKLILPNFCCSAFQVYFLREIMDKNYFPFWYTNENTEDIFGYWQYSINKF